MSSRLWTLVWSEKCLSIYGGFFPSILHHEEMIFTHSFHTPVLSIIATAWQTLPKGFRTVDVIIFWFIHTQKYLELSLWLKESWWIHQKSALKELVPVMVLFFMCGECKHSNERYASCASILDMDAESWVFRCVFIWYDDMIFLYLYSVVQYIYSVEDV